MRSFIPLALALAAALTACSESAPPRDATVEDRPRDAAPDAADLDAADARDDVSPDAPAPLDATDATDAMDATDAEDAGPRQGWIRFVNIAPGAGTVRFVATNLPMYPPARVEFVVREGEASPYLLSPAGDFYFDAYPADAPDGATTLVEQSNGAVYFQTGCTVALVGRVGGDVREGTHRRLYRFPDLPVRIEGTAPVRFIPAVSDVLFNDVLEGEALVVRRQQYVEATGFRRLTPGPHTFVLRDHESRAPVGGPVSVTVEDGPSQSLFLWGLAGGDAGSTLRALLLNDIPAGRVLH